MELCSRWLLLARRAQIDIVGPAGSGAFGTSVTALPNGNIVVTDPYYDAGATVDVGAVYLYDGATGGLISALTGSTAGDQVGWDDWLEEPAVTVLSNGNYVVGSPNWDNSAAENAGAVTWGSGTTGVSGVVSAANSLVGGTAVDRVGSVTALSNGNYVVRSSGWDSGAAVDAGAVTWGSGMSGVAGPITAENSVRGAAEGNQGRSMVWAYDYANRQLVVGRPADNIVTLFVLPPVHAVFLPVVLKSTP